MRYGTIHDLYVSKEFRSLRLQLMHERTAGDGMLYCEHCRRPIVEPYDCIAHHKVEVTMGNLWDMDVTLNPDNIALVHHRCHNEIHRRFGRIIRKVYMVWGAPRAGKTTYVAQVRDEGDMVVDIDSIWRCLGDDALAKPDALKPVVFSIRDAMYQAILTRMGRWANAYVITTRPDRRLADRMGAEMIYIPADRETCLARCKNAIWGRFVNDWFDHPPVEVDSDG